MLKPVFADTSNQAKKSAKEATLNNAFCSGDDEDTCYRQMMRLTYLNQQRDGGAHLASAVW